MKLVCVFVKSTLLVCMNSEVKKTFCAHRTSPKVASAASPFMFPEEDDIKGLPDPNDDIQVWCWKSSAMTGQLLLALDPLSS